MKFEKELVTNDELKQIFLKFFTPEAERAKHENIGGGKKMISYLTEVTELGFFNF